MLRIRENIFETNSSSAHSIVLRQKYNENSVEKNLKTFNEIIGKNNNTYVLDKEGKPIYLPKDDEDSELDF